MNFKRLRGIAAVAFTTIAAALLAGCMNSMAGSVDSSSRMATLQLSATGIPDEYAKEFAAYCERQQRAASRSILPDNPFQVNDTTLTLVLTGKSTTGMPLADKTVTLKATENADVYDFDDPIALDAMVWNLVLTAYKNYNATTKTGDAVLRGYCSADLRNGSGTAKFVMGIAGLTTPGGVTLKGSIVDEKDISMFYTMGIYRKDNLKDAGGDTTPTETTGTLTSNTGANEDFTFIANSVPPGTYLYIMKFYTDSTKTKIVGSFTDTIVINPGNDLKKEDLLINVIEKMPTPPENLKAYLVKNLDDDGTYNVKVTWDQAKYVTNYELNVVEYDGDIDNIDTYFTPNGTTGLINNGTIYGMSVLDDGNPKTIKDFPGSSVFGKDSSSMMYGDTSCVLRLETGKLYEIQLRARNYIGVSEWVGRVAGDTGITGLTEYAAPTAQRINRLRITYKFKGGTLTLGGSTNIKDMYVDYQSWTVNADLLKIVPQDGAPATANTLANSSGAEFAAWKLDGGTAVKEVTDNDTVTTTVGDEVKGYTYKDVSVKASFGNKLTGNISQADGIKDVKRTDIDVVYTLGNGTAVDPFAESNGHYEVSRLTEGKANTIKITLNKVGTDLSADGTEYANVRFEASTISGDVSGERTDTTNTVQYKINLNSFDGTVLEVRVIADTKNGKGLSQTFVFEVQ